MQPSARCTHYHTYLLPNLSQNNVISRGTVHWQQWNPLHSINFVILDLLSFSTFCHFRRFVIWRFVIRCFVIQRFVFWPFVSFDVLTYGHLITCNKREIKTLSYKKLELVDLVCFVRILNYNLRRMWQPVLVCLSLVGVVLGASSRDLPQLGKDKGTHHWFNSF